MQVWSFLGVQRKSSVLGDLHEVSQQSEPAEGWGRVMNEIQVLCPDQWLRLLDYENYYAARRQYYYEETVRGCDKRIETPFSRKWRAAQSFFFLSPDELFTGSGTYFKNWETTCISNKSKEQNQSIEIFSSVW